MAKNGSKLLQIGSGRGDLFDNAGFLDGLGRKLIKLIKTGSRLKKKQLKPAKNNADGQKQLNGSKWLKNGSGSTGRFSPYGTKLLEW